LERALTKTNCFFLHKIVDCIIEDSLQEHKTELEGKIVVNTLKNKKEVSQEASVTIDEEAREKKESNIDSSFDSRFADNFDFLMSALKERREGKISDVEEGKVDEEDSKFNDYDEKIRGGAAI